MGRRVPPPQPDDADRRVGFAKRAVLGTPPIDEAFQHPVLRVLTVMYKATAEERKRFEFTRATPNLKPYNGDPQTGCLGGEWFYAFYKMETDNQTNTNSRGCDTSNLGKWLNTQVNENNGSFCIHCHSPAFETDYSRIIYDTIVRGPVKAGPPPTAPAREAPPCDSTPSPTLPSDVPVRPLSVWNTGEETAKAMFDCFSWKTFVAVSWPADPKKRGRPDRNKSIKKPGDSPAVWQTYMPPVMKVCGTTANGEFELGENCFAIVPPVLRNPVVESYMTTYHLVADKPEQVSNRGCLNCHFLGAQGSFVWLDATANQVPVKVE